MTEKLNVLEVPEIPYTAFLGEKFRLYGLTFEALPPAYGGAALKDEDTGEIYIAGSLTVFEGVGISQHWATADGQDAMDKIRHAKRLAHVPNPFTGV